MDNEKFGNFIKELRKEKNLTQKELAKEINITDKAISKWERGLSFPDITMLNILSKEFNVSIEELLNGERIKTENKENENSNIKEKIDIEKAVKEALEKANNKEEKRKAKIEKAKKITKIISTIVFAIFVILQCAYFYLSYQYGFEYIIDSLFYIVNEIILITMFLFLLFTFKNKKVKIITISVFVIISLINIIFMSIYGFRNKTFISYSNNLQYQFIVKQDKETNEVKIYKNAIVIFARQMQNLVEPANNVKVQWISRDIFSITYTNNDDELKEYVVTLDENNYKSSYRPFDEALIGNWQSVNYSNKTTRLYVDSKNIRVILNDDIYTFEIEDCVSVREEAIILYSNEIPRFIVALDDDAELDEDTGIIKDEGTIIISEISTAKTKKEELYCTTPKTNDLSNYNYVNLAAKQYAIRNGLLYFSYDGEKTAVVPGNFSKIESYNEGQYQISDEKIVFYYEANNGKYIVFSEDKGQNWQTEKLPFDGSIKFISFPTSKVGYILEFTDETMGTATGAIYKTTDGGISWQEVFTGLSDGYYSNVFKSGTEMIFANENVGFITMPDRMGEVSYLYITKDGGVNFEKLELATNPDCDYYLLPTIENGEIHIKIAVGYASDESSYKTVEEFVSKDNGETFEKE